MFALQVAGMELTVIAFIGIILLIGIVKKNGISAVCRPSARSSRPASSASVRS
jgi:multidrug efflux pump subunit AcrB